MEKYLDIEFKRISNYVYENLKAQLQILYYFEDLVDEDIILRFDNEIKTLIKEYYDNNESLSDYCFEDFYNTSSEMLSDYNDFNNIIHSLYKKQRIKWGEY